MTHRTLLLFAHLGAELAIIGRALRDAGYLVFPARYHEEGVDALTRVHPDIVLVDVAHHRAVASAAFRALAAEIGAQVLFYARKGAGDAAARTAAAELPYPILEFTGDGPALIEQMVEARPAA